MRYVFCGNMFSDIDGDIKKMKVPPPVSSHKFQENMIRGLLANDQKVYVVNIPRVRYYPHYPKVFFKKSKFINPTGVRGINIGFVNLPLINYLTQRLSLKKELRRITGKKGKYTLISFNNYLPQNRAMVEVKKKKKNVYICNVLGDLHGSYGVRVAGRYVGLKGKLIERIEAEQDRLSAESDAFGFLTGFMAEALGVQDKPYTVIEGIYSGEKKEIINTDTENKTIFYAGAVEEEYGLLHLLRAFSMINDSSFRLRIAGGGGAVKAVEDYSKKDSRISYLGYITPEEVERNQMEATCLVNPRTSDHEYVKYAFPSKNMECLASGKPYVAHRLPCNPPEYDMYFQCPESESDEDLAAEMVRVCNLPARERQRIGSEAQRFILNMKNPRMQCSKIVELMNKVERERC